MPKQKTRPNIVTSQRIKELRKLRKLTQADLASKIGKSDQMIRKYESGKEGVPTSSIYALAAALDCCPEYLWDATDCITQTEYDAEQAEIDSTIKKSFRCMKNTGKLLNAGSGLWRIWQESFWIAP